MEATTTQVTTTAPTAVTEGDSGSVDGGQLQLQLIRFVKGGIYRREYFGPAAIHRQAVFHSVDSKGYVVDLKGYVVDLKGYVVDLKGYVVALKGYVVDLKGYSVDLKGYKWRVVTFLVELIRIVKELCYFPSI
eukprot:400978-Prorocentrum_minimum.AAC.1